MGTRLGRREFLRTAGLAGVAGMVGEERTAAAMGSRPWGARRQRSRVVVIRDAALAADPSLLTSAVVLRFINEAAAVLANESRPADAWAHWFEPSDRVAIKVNCLGLPTSHAVGEAVAQAIAAAGVAPGNTIIWDRTNRELARAGYTLRRNGRDICCFGTDSLGGRRGGYDDTVSTSGGIGSLYSRIVTDECDALVSAAVLKDHNLAGLSCTLKNFYGSIHNPNKYHDNGCDPYVADVCAHRHIRNRLRLAVCDATLAQYNGGPPSRRRWQWPYGGLIVSGDAVALDRVALEILEQKRAQEGMNRLELDNRPAHYLESAAARGLGQAELRNIEVVSIGRPWLEVT